VQDKISVQELKIAISKSRQEQKEESTEESLAIYALAGILNSNQEK